MTKGILAFDPSWAGVVGWGYIFGETIRSGSFKSKKKANEPCRRSYELFQGYLRVLKQSFMEDEIIIGYENPLGWLLAAARRGRGGRRPVTKASLNGAVMAVGVCRMAIGWLINQNDLDITIVEVDTQKARREMGVDHWANIYHSDVNKLLELGGYDNQKKAMVGVAVARILENDGFELTYPPDDHQADALLFALWLRGKLAEI